MKKKILFILVAIAFSISANAQFIENKQTISVTTGLGVIKGKSGNLFFPSGVDQSNLNIGISYNHTLLKWIDGGITLGYYKLSGIKESSGFVEVVTSGGSFFSGGPEIIFHTPHLSTGPLNKLRFGIALSPQYQYYSGDRLLSIDNEIVPVGEFHQPKSKIEMNNSSTGFGAKLSPEINCRLSQRFGLKLVYNLQLLNVYTGYEREQIMANSLMGGLLFTFGNKKSLY